MSPNAERALFVRAAQSKLKRELKTKIDEYAERKKRKFLSARRDRRLY